MIVTVTLNPAVDVTLTVKSFAPGEVNRAVEMQKSAGGKGINVSRTLKVLGEPSTALTIVGSDSVREFQRLAREAGIQIIYISVPGEIRSNIHVMDNSTGLLYKVNQPGTTLDEIHFQHFKMLYMQQLKTASAVALGGSLPPDASKNCYRELTELATRLGIPVVVDAVGRVLMETLRAKPFIAKPNRRELEVTFDIKIATEQELIDAASEVVRLGAECAIVSDGANPVIAAFNSRIYRVAPPRIRARGTTGAGDALAAGFLSRSVNRANFEESLVYGVAVATATCITDEGETAKKADVERMLRATKIRRID